MLRESASLSDDSSFELSSISLWDAEKKTGREGSKYFPTLTGLSQSLWSEQLQICRVCKRSWKCPSNPFVRPRNVKPFCELPWSEITGFHSGPQMTRQAPFGSDIALKRENAIWNHFKFDAAIIIFIWNQFKFHTASEGRNFYVLNSFFAISKFQFSWSWFLRLANTSRNTELSEV